MSHVTNTIWQEFPDSAEVIHFLKMTNPHFVEVASRYRSLNKMIHRIEAGIEAASDSRLTELKKRRLALKDEIDSLLTSTS